MTSVSIKSEIPPKPKRSWLNIVRWHWKSARLLAFLGFAWVVYEALYVFLGPNFHVVVNHRCFRAGQPTPTYIASWVQSHGIRTVINLRGENPGQPWYDAEVKTLARLGVELRNIPICGTARNEEASLRRLVDAVENAPEPVLLHCYQGIDRTGFAAAVYLLIRTDTPLDEAREQLHVSYGHIPVGRCGSMDEMLDDYGNWLDEYGFDHSPEMFCRWVREEYRQ